MKKIAFFIGALFLTGCMTQPFLSEEGARVRVVKEKPEGCESLGKFQGGAMFSPEQGYGDYEKENSMNVLRNEVADDDGDTVRVSNVFEKIHSPRGITFGVYPRFLITEGYGYKCNK